MDSATASTAAPVLPIHFGEFTATYTPNDELSTITTNVTVYPEEGNWNPVDSYTRQADRVYDALRRPTSLTVSSDESGVATIARTFEYAFGSNTGETWRTGPDGVETYTRRDVRGQIEHYRRGPELFPILTADYTYDDRGLLTFVGRSNGQQTHYAYDVAQRLIQIRHADGFGVTIRKYAYFYDVRDLITRIGEYVGLGEVLEAYVGEYVGEPNLHVTVRIFQGRLFAELRGEGDAELFAESGSAFFTRAGNATVVFRKDPDGRVPHVDFTFRDQSARMEKIR